MLSTKIQGWTTSQKNLMSHIGFWLIMFLYYVSSSWNFYTDKAALIERYVLKTSIQVLLTYAIIFVLIPHFLNKNRKWLFALSGLVLVYAVYVIYTLIRYYYYDPKYFDDAPKFDLVGRFFDLSFYLNEITWFIFPAVILVTFQYYRNQKELISLREQKKITEINLLKNQLNPHFLFNTLNNLYTLALKNSKRTPEVIAKLSSILDYMLYHCNEKYVSLSGEINLINNYIELEKVRYGKRLDINFDYKTNPGAQIAPLILLTFVENAFKHGVKEEINVAKIDIQLESNESQIFFQIQNSIPTHAQAKDSNKDSSIGLQNIQKQLDILYPNSYYLEINKSIQNYSVTLKLMPYAL